MKTILDFKQWLVLTEIGESNIETKRGSELFADPAMEVAMYVLYRHSYDPINKRDREEEIKHHVSQGSSPDEAEGLAKTSAVGWSHGEWTKPSSGGTRSPKWIFTGTFPNEQDLNAIRAMMGQSQGFGGNPQIQQIADQIIQTGQPSMQYAGGLSWRDDKPGSIKIVGTWGNNSIAKMRAAAQVINNANTKGLEVFTGADAQLRQMIDDAEKKMPKFHQKGIVPAPTLGLQTPPKEVIPLLYDMLTQHPAARGSGDWDGFNPETGGMYMNLSGTGRREKFVYGNKPMWKNGIGKALQKAGVTADKAGQARMALQSGGPMAGMAAQMINQKLKKIFPNSNDIPASGLIWLLSQVA